MQADRDKISDTVHAEQKSKIDVGRKAWRGVMLGAVGSLAFFLSTLGNLAKTYRTHGNPIKNLETHDIILFSLPLLVISYFVLEAANDNDEVNAS